KKRYYVPVGKHIFEVDIFEGENEGLVLAEVELQTPDEVYEKPDWLGQEVTGNKKFYNSALSQEPFKSW
ncbi:MAG: adenylate cyclase, partial [Paludibacter sp.]